ncbi:U3 small nucleolar RNA-interacting protein 2 [Lutzomyia longipalpis]|uniref:U3 small nucleolar RNA-interacting protein 2 n=1 Tax=Lutzomyia longipalpis TaxID=7200 RepID=UPI0024845C18|nr:U3 small nucleolar RNA-interacting protein 2 [Lutzomyia longipalpis]
MSFFIRGKAGGKAPGKPAGKPAGRMKEKFKKSLPQGDQKPFSGKRKKFEDEEIASDEEILSNDGDLPVGMSSEDEVETPQEKRLRLAKKYLEEIEKEELKRHEEKNLDVNVDKRLANEYLDSVGKLRRYVANTYLGVDEPRIVKHKSQKTPITCLCLSKDGKILFSGSKSPTIVKWCVEEWRPLGVINLLEGVKEDKKRTKVSGVCLAMTSDGKFLAVADGSSGIRVYSPDTLTPIGVLRAHRKPVTALAARRDTHEIYSGSADRTVIVWSLDEMAKIEIMFGHQAAVTDLDALTRDRAISSGGNDCSIRVWKVSEESQLVYNGHSGNIDSVRLINEENFLSSGDDGSLCVWSTMKKKPLCTQSLAHGKSPINGEPNWISAIATLTNTELVASGSCDGFIRIWKLESHFRKCVQLMEIPMPGFINALTFTPDGNYLIAAIGQEHRLGRWWRLPEGKNCIAIIPFRRKT